MRICQVVHGFPPVERTGVENYTLGLCRALARAGHRVEVFVPRRDPGLAGLASRREERDGFAVNWIAHNHVPGSPREALLVPELKGAFAAFLERERPEVVHFQHLIKLGIGLVEVARARGLPTVYTAHDYYPICHRYTLLLPDLTRCEARADSRACARCDLALAHVNAQPDLGDPQGSVLREQLSAPAWGTLQGILAGRAEPSGPAAEVLQAAVEQRTELDRLRAEAYQAFDIVLAPSLHLIAELERGGFPPGRIEHQPLGFENDDLAGLARVRSEPARPVRFAYLGGMSKHKGVHVLLDAFARLGGRAELSIWGDSSDRAYVDLLRRRCGEVGAQWRGRYVRADERAILAGIDALVVPSIWVENQPLVIHEGFSAGRPVLASNLGAIPEYVRDGVNGLLFAPGDAADLARVLARCTEEPELLPTLARGIGPVKGMDQEVRELVPRYERLLATRRAARVVVELPQSLERAVADFERLSALPSRELFARVLAGLDELRDAWSGDLGATSAVELLAAGLGEGSEAQDRLREARNEITWLREGREELVTVFQDLERVLGQAEDGRQIQAEQLESAGTYVRQKEAEVSQAHERMHALEEVIAQKNRHIGEVEGHLQEAGRYIRHKDQEYLDLEVELQKAAEYAHVKEEELRAALVRARAREEELRGAGESARGLAEDLRRADESARDLERELQTTQDSERALDLGARSVAEVGVMALHAQERVLNRALRPILERLHALIDPGGRLQLPAEGASFVELLENLSLVRDGLDTLAEELEWMRPQRAELLWCRERVTHLLALYEKSSFVRLLLRPTALGGKLRKWSEAHARQEPRA